MADGLGSARGLAGGRTRGDAAAWPRGRADGTRCGRAPTRAAKGAFYAIALLCVLVMVAIARAHDPAIV